jgi:serine protease Do
VQDDTGLLVVDVPTAWSELQTDTVTDDAGDEYAQIIAAPSVSGYLDTYDVPGMSIAIDLAGTKTIDDWLASSDFTGDCVTDGAEPYDDGLYVGSLQVWYGCGTTGAQLLVIAAGPPGEEFSVRVVVQALTDADYEAFDQIVRTFRVITE